MKSNEILILGGTILAALVLFKGRASSSINQSVPFISPFLSMLGKAETQALESINQNVTTLQGVKESNLDIRNKNLQVAQSILDLERSTADVKISQVQTELDKVQGFIGSQQKFTASRAFASLAPPQQGWQNNAQALLRKFSGVSQGNSLFPDFRLIANRENFGIVQQQAQFETAQQNIGKANEMIIRQQGEIDRLNEEYQTRFGGISRYG